MEIKDIAAVSGKGGLFKIVKPTKTGVLLESLDDNKNRIVASIHNKVSVLDEISIYTTTTDGTFALKEVLYTIFKEFGDDIGVDKNSDAEELKSFMGHVLPDYDAERVYVSDIKKMVNWYSILLKEAPELLKKPVDKADEPAPKS